MVFRVRIGPKQSLLVAGVLLGGGRGGLLWRHLYVVVLGEWKGAADNVKNKTEAVRIHSNVVFHTRAVFFIMDTFKHSFRAI